MPPLRAFRVAIAVLGLAAALVQPVDAGGPCCERCGCELHVKRVCHLVVTWEDVSVPEYECQPVEVFCPDKGKVCHSGPRCDTVYHLDTHWKCTTPCGCCGPKVYESTTSCSCETCCKWQTLYGAKPTGCMSTQCVQQPVGKCVERVPVTKWVVTYVCDDCCKHCKSCR